MDTCEEIDDFLYFWAGSSDYFNLLKYIFNQFFFRLLCFRRKQKKIFGDKFANDLVLDFIYFNFISDDWINELVEFLSIYIDCEACFYMIFRGIVISFECIDILYGLF